MHNVLTMKGPSWRSNRNEDDDFFAVMEIGSNPPLLLSANTVIITNFSSFCAERKGRGSSTGSCLSLSFCCEGSWKVVGVDHRLYRVPGLPSSRPNWIPPLPHRNRVLLSPFGSKGGDTLAYGGVGVGRTQFRRRDRHSGTQCIL
jgi:hypothetical protein